MREMKLKILLVAPMDNDIFYKLVELSNEITKMTTNAPQFIDASIVFAPYIPITVQSSINFDRREGVIFQEYSKHSKENLADGYYTSNWYLAEVIGFEQEDGKVQVIKKGKRLKRLLKNKEKFFAKYFVEAL